MKLRKCARPDKTRAGFFILQPDKERIDAFSAGQSGNLAGRPPGARNKATLIAEMLLQGEAEEITRKVIEQAKSGDVSALRMCLDRLAPRSRHRTVAIELPELKTAADAASGIATIAARIVAGEITPHEGGEIVRVIDAFVRSYETTILEERMQRLEQWTSPPIAATHEEDAIDQGSAP